MSAKIFICYAHEDEALLNKLKAHLRPLQRQGLIDLWHDRDITAGTEWEQEITKHLNEADIILLLVSPDFMNSDYCYSIEMERALERHERKEARVIPVILRHIDWQGERIGRLQALPTNALPVTDPDWYSLDRAFLNVTQGIRKIVTDFFSTSSSFKSDATSGDMENRALPVLAHLVVVDSGPSKILQGTSFDLEPQTCIGRNVTNTIILSDKFISGEHTRLWYHNGTWCVQDAGSTTGTYVNNEPARDPIPLGLGDIIQIGFIRFKLTS